MVLKNSQGLCYWITGLSAAGKTTIASELARLIRESGSTIILLDGDVLRNVLDTQAYSRDERLALGFKYSRMAKLLTDQGANIIIATIALFHEIHSWNREHILNYVEVYLDVPKYELERRDPKGLYKKFRKGEVKNVAGLDQIVDFPVDPQFHFRWYEGLEPSNISNELFEHFKKSLLKQNL